jgi:hypothetical protein
VCGRMTRAGGSKPSAGAGAARAPALCGAPGPAPLGRCCGWWCCCCCGCCCWCSNCCW